VLLKRLQDLDHQQSVAIIINVQTRLLSTLALLSTLRYAGMPLILLDCESQDGSVQWFNDLQRHYDFHLVRAPLRPHGEALDWIFSAVAADHVLLVDSDVEVLSSDMLNRMRQLLDENTVRRTV
jgi:hypothetical protein